MVASLPIPNHRPTGAPRLPTTALAALALAALLCAAPSAAADPVRLTATAATVGDGSAIGGPLRLLLAEDLAPLGGLPSASNPLPPFRILADRLTLMSDASDGSLATPVSGSRLFPETTVEHHEDARLEAAGHRPGYRVYVAALPGEAAPRVSFTDACVRLGVADVPEVERHAFVNHSRPGIVVALGEALRVAPCGDALVTVQGAFLVRLWGVDALLSTPDGNRVVETGQSPIVGVDGVPAGPTQDREAFAEVHGSLEMPLRAPARLYVGDVEGTVTGRLQLGNAHGVVATATGEHPLRGATVVLEGQGGRFTVAGHGHEPLGVTLAGPWAMGPPPPEAPLAQVTAPALPAALAVAAVGVAIVLATRRR